MAEQPMTSPRLAAPILLVFVLTFAPCGALAQNSQAPLAGATMPSKPTLPDLEQPFPHRPGDEFGVLVTLPKRTIVYLQGRSTWENAPDKLIESFAALGDYLAKHGIRPDGSPMTIYTDTDDTGFRFRVAVPVAAAPKDAPKGDIAVGEAPSGKALKFVHRGTYDAMDSTYEAITDYLDDKGLDAKDVFVEEYVSGPLQAGDHPMVVDIFVPVN
jgi:effector-binding domain-containing protein